MKDNKVTLQNRDRAVIIAPINDILLKSTDQVA